MVLINTDGITGVSAVHKPGSDRRPCLESGAALIKSPTQQSISGRTDSLNLSVQTGYFEPDLH